LPVAGNPLGAGSPCGCRLFVLDVDRCGHPHQVEFFDQARIGASSGNVGHAGCGLLVLLDRCWRAGAQVEGLGVGVEGVNHGFFRYGNTLL